MLSLCGLGCAGSSSCFGIGARIVTSNDGADSAAASRTRTTVPAVAVPDLTVIATLHQPGVVLHLIPQTEAVPVVSVRSSSTLVPFGNVPVGSLSGSRNVTRALGTAFPSVSVTRMVKPRYEVVPGSCIRPSPSITWMRRSAFARVAHNSRVSALLQCLRSSVLCAEQDDRDVVRSAGVASGINERVAFRFERLLAF